MTDNIQASMFAGNQGVSVKSDYGLWGTTTRKMKFRISSACGELDKDKSIVRIPIQFTNMPNVKRATLVPETFSLSLNADPVKAVSNPPVLTDTGIVPSNYWGQSNAPPPWSQVCLRCRQLSQPNSYDNGATINGVGGGVGTALQKTDHSGFQGNSNIIMSMPCLSGHGQDDATDRLVQTFRNYSGNEYDCGIELANNCFQVDAWEFGITNEWGQYYELGGNATPDILRHSWYAEFSIVYEPEKTDFDLN